MEKGDLVISKLRWSDMGGYTCVAQSPLDRDMEKTFLYPMDEGKSKKRKRELVDQFFYISKKRNEFIERLITIYICNNYKFLCLLRLIMKMEKYNKFRIFSKYQTYPFI